MTPVRHESRWLLPDSPPNRATQKDLVHGIERLTANYTTGHLI